MAVYEVNGKAPRVHELAWVADSAQVMGQVTLAAHASVWFGCVLRGDADAIFVGEGSNIQDGCILHVDRGFALDVGQRVTVGHHAMLHGCSVGDESLIGIGAVVLNGARIGKNCLVGAGALVTEGKAFADGSMILGSPARVVRQLTPEQIEGVRQNARHYMENARTYRASLKKLA
ncbi:MAG: gamma carbonic anhydrase family protein [Burkholderiaceae bacterium]|jgi:carbonic anhydrase/acetyltransferase-like protein (isoleucine patch superfamily)|nr:gamma carbonic anhydrase family protein [Burkholderiaceae bacterium]